MSAAQKPKPPKSADIVGSVPVIRRPAPSTSLYGKKPGTNALLAQRQLLENEFGSRPTDAEVARYPAAVRLSLVIGGGMLSWAAVIGAVGIGVSLFK